MQFIMSVRHFVSEVSQLYLFGGWLSSIPQINKADISNMSSTKGNNILMPTARTFS